MQTRPFPYERLPKLTHAQLRVQRGVAALWDGPHRSQALETARSVLGAGVRWRAGLAEFCRAQQLASQIAMRGHSVRMLLEQTGVSLDAGLVLEISSVSAQRLVDRALGGDDVPAESPALLPLDEISQGALAYVMARVLAAHGGALVLRELSIDAGAIARWLPDAALVIWPFELQVGSDRIHVRAYVPETLQVPSRMPVGETDLRALPLTLIAEIGRTCLPLSAATDLALGDVVVLDHSQLVHDGDRFDGTVTVRVAGSCSHFTCRARDTGLEVERFDNTLEPNMTTGRLSPNPDHDVDNAGVALDAPLELTVELARFSLTLGELQRTRVGDVLVTGRRIGERVTLRVAGRALAQGELVDVEGEVGVRILEFLQES
jgi:type III secretion system YscQ/HrcQ family protein